MGCFPGYSLAQGRIDPGICCTSWIRCDGRLATANWLAGFLQSEVAALQSKVTKESSALDARLVELVANWEQEKPVQGTLAPAHVLKVLEDFDGMRMLPSSQ